MPCRKMTPVVDWRPGVSLQPPAGAKARWVTGYEMETFSAIGRVYRGQDCATFLSLLSLDSL